MSIGSDPVTHHTSLAEIEEQEHFTVEKEQHACMPPLTHDTTPFSGVRFESSPSATAVVFQSLTPHLKRQTCMWTLPWSHGTSSTLRSNCCGYFLFLFVAIV
jgi:hypothetical protein